MELEVDPDFVFNSATLSRALELLGTTPLADYTAAGLPLSLPVQGHGSAAALELLAPLVLGAAARLDEPDAIAHMDPPTPWITWALALWNARLNQNLLHPATAPFAKRAEALALDWLAPFFGMDGGHMTPGSTVANLTALWAARDAAGAKRVVASAASHVSVAKCAHLLGMNYEEVPVDADQRLDVSALPDLSDACLVLTAGTTSSGAIDPLRVCGLAAWSHVDAAWAGPLRLSKRHMHLLAGIDLADSVSVSAHKWLFQPKESALVLFRETERANRALSFGGAYLTAPNIGLLGSHGAVAIPLLGTLLAWGQEGIADRLDRCMSFANRFANWLEHSPSYDLLGPPQAGVLLFRPVHGNVDEAYQALPTGMVSTTTVCNQRWLRCAFANPCADIESAIESLERYAHS